MAVREINVEVKAVYGTPLIYPVCNDAHRFAALTGKRTFSPKDIENIRGLGYIVKAIVPEYPSILGVTA